MICVRVPASSANMGAGFDTLGIALNLYSVVEVAERKSGLEIISNTGGDTVHNDKHNLIYRAMERVFERTDYHPNGLFIRQTSKIPMTRGLGSSSACIVGGMLAANVLSGRQLSYKDILHMASQMEGHPDNVGPALYGGLCISANIDDRTVVKSTKLVNDLKYVVMIPDFFVATKKSRGTLPDFVSRQDAASNISSSLMLYHSLVTGDFSELKYGVSDKLHQPYRKSYIDGFDDIFEKTYENGSLATYLSGSGPTIMSIIEGDGKEFAYKMENFFRLSSRKWRCTVLECDNVGSVVWETPDK